MYDVSKFATVNIAGGYLSSLSRLSNLFGVQCYDETDE